MVDIAFDTDHNPDTGGNGVEYAFFIASDGWDFVKWDGSKFVRASAPSANGSYANGVATFKVSKADLGGVADFTFWASTFQMDANGNFIAEDTAPDGTAAYKYAFTKPLTLRPGRDGRAGEAGGGQGARRPDEGHARDTGGPLATGAVTCTARVGTAALKASGRVSGGVATCTMRLPKTAKGKLVRVTMKVTFQGVSTTKTFSARAK